MSSIRTIGRLLTYILVMSIYLFSGQAGAAPGDAALSCEPVDRIVSLCGLEKPEDIVIGPNSSGLIFSEFGENGSLASLNTHTGKVKRIYRTSGSPMSVEELWGEPSCTLPPVSFQPHGIDLSQRGDGRWQLLVVNHGGRESVEFFEISLDEDNAPQAFWRGCAVAPDQGNFNDVAALPGEGFLVTQMADKDSQTWQVLLTYVGVDSGFVYRWTPDAGYSAVPNTEGKMPNGIIVSPDGSTFYLNLYFGNELRKHDLASGKILGSVELDKPDNLSWNPRGNLYVASQHASLFQLLKSLDKKTPGPSLLPFSIYEVNPETMEKTLVLHREGEPMGAGTVAVELDGFLYIGSYVGDRMIKVAVD